MSKEIGLYSISLGIMGIGMAIIATETLFAKWVYDEVGKQR